MLQCAAACCSVLQCVAVCVAACSSVLQCFVACCHVSQCIAACCRMLQRAAAISIPVEPIAFGVLFNRVLFIGSLQSKPRGSSFNETREYRPQ